MSLDPEVAALYRRFRTNGTDTRHDALHLGVRLVIDSVLRGLLTLGILLPLSSTHAEAPGRCVAVPVPTDSQAVTCPLDPSMAGRPLRFVAEFAGSHDDTRLKLTATLDGEPLTCEEGSRTTLFAEDGEVRLDCRFRSKGRSGAAGSGVPLLRVALTVHHAQFVSASLAAD